MNRSIDIGRMLGIRLRVQPLLLWLVAFLVLANLSSGGTAAALRVLIDVGLLGLLVVLHELGHALVARQFGVNVLDITLWPLGGMARMAELPENPKVEAWVAIAGPAVNFVLAAIAIPFLLVLGGLAGSGEDAATLTAASDFAWRFILFNLVLGGFNLLPAFPMDGGRILRAALATRQGWLPATEQAVRVGRWLAWTGIALGLLRWQPILMLVSGFVLWAGWQELSHVRLRHAGGRGGLFDLFEAARRGAERASRASHASGSSQRADGSTEPRATGAAGFELGELGGGGFSDEDVERLERFRGRLPGFGR